MEERITEDGETRITEDGEIRILEGSEHLAMTIATTITGDQQASY